MWQRIRKKYLIGLAVIVMAYPVSFLPSLYYLMYYAQPTATNIHAFQQIYDIPIQILPANVSEAVIHGFGYRQPEAKSLANRLKFRNLAAFT